MKELSGFHSNRRLLSFDQLFFEHPDEFYELHYTNIFVEIYALSTKAFCTGDSGRRTKSPWAREYPDQFYKYTELLAHPDTHAGKWHRLLRDEEERSYLVQAMIMKILDSQVFSSLLFGAGAEHIKVLQSEDSSLINSEGFRRSALRAHANRTYMESVGQTPPRFWEEVDEITARTLTLLLPLYQYVGKVQSVPQLSVPEFYQSLHDVIAYAGWLSVSIRLSPAIFITEWLVPGDRHEVLSEQVNLSRKLYDYSKHAADRHDKQSVGDKHGKVKAKRTPRVKISVAPHVKRYTHGTDGGIKGLTVYTVMRPHAIWYHGQESNYEDEQLFVSLPDYTNVVRRRRRPVPTSLALFILFVWMIFLYFTARNNFALIQNWVLDLWATSSPNLAPELPELPEPELVVPTWFNSFDWDAIARRYVFSRV